MKTIDPETLLAAHQWRYATKQFDAVRKIDAATWSALEQTLILSPSSFGLQPWKFIVITDQSVKDALVAQAWGQRQVADASHVVVFTVKDPLTADDVRRLIERTAKIQNTPLDKLAGYEKVVVGFLDKPPYPLNMKEWSTRQVYIALGNFMTSAALLGVDTCPMEGLDPAGFDKVLGLEGKGYHTVAACPAGFRSPGDRYATLPKVRYSAEEVIDRRS